MSEDKGIRISQAARQFNVGVNTVIDFLKSKGYKEVAEGGPNAKIPKEVFALLVKEFQNDINQKKEASTITIGKKVENVTLKAESTSSAVSAKHDDEEIEYKNFKSEIEEVDKIETKIQLTGPKILGKIDLDALKPKTSSPKSTDITPKNKDKSEGKQNTTKVTTRQKDVEEKVNLPDQKTNTETKTNLTTEYEVEKNKDKKIYVENKDLEKPKAVQETSHDVIEAKAETLKGLTVLGKIEIPDENRTYKKETISFKDKEKKEKKKRKRLTPAVPVKADFKEDENFELFDKKNYSNQTKFNKLKNQQQDKYYKQNQAKHTTTHKNEKPEISEKEIQEKLKDTLAKIGGARKEAFANRAKLRKEKRQAIASAQEEKQMAEQENAKVLKVTEFLSTADLASLMDVSVNELISTALNLGIFVSINQRLDAELITVLADEFGYSVEFISAKEEVIEIEEDKPEDLLPRPPIVTIMGHVDHGKTSLLDYIRRSNVAAKEAGGITQHIGAYEVVTENGKKITFLDTPGHEAFTAMRARGAKITDIAIIVIAADDSVMPQTKEAINHAQVAQVPIVFALNKIDKPNANPDKIREELAKLNILVEEWGGRYQCQEISAKTGKGVPELLEKVLLEAELLELKANPNKKALGTVIEASLDKGRGYVATLLVQAGTLKIGDVVLAGKHYGKVKAMMDHTGKKLSQAGPSCPVQILGLDGAPQAGDKFHVMDSEREAREIATRREQILREQSVRTKKHITLDEIGRRLAIGNFKELNIIIKGDVDGSVEALSDALLKLSTEEIKVNILHKGVGQISESDVLLASASDAIIVGFQVRPSQNARKLAENEQIEIRTYSIIYDVINDVKDAIEGMLSPKIEEVVVGNLEVRETFKISKVGTIAGCYVTDGYIKRTNQIRVIRDGIVIYTGEILSLKRFKDDVSEVKSGYECGLSIKGFNDIQVGDVIESFEQREVKRKI